MIDIQATNDFSRSVRLVRRYDTIRYDTIKIDRFIYLLTFEFRGGAARGRCDKDTFKRGRVRVSWVSPCVRALVVCMYMFMYMYKYAWIACIRADG